MSFADVERDPVGQVRDIYEKLKLCGFERFQPKLQRYVDSLKNYEKNSFPPLSADLRRQVGQAWQRSFEEWKYPL